jgi:TolB protein
MQAPTTPPLPVIETAPPTQETTETSVTATVTAPKLSGKIAFVRDRGNYFGWDIFTADADGTNIVDITNRVGNDLWASWSPDNSKIAFQSTNNMGTPSIYVMDADGGNIRLLTTGVATCQYPAWSPDGKHIAYSSTQLACLDIFIMDADGSNKKAVMPAMPRGTPLGCRTAQVSASWFPDSLKIAYASRDYDLWNIKDITAFNNISDLLTAGDVMSNTYPIRTDIYGWKFPVDNGWSKLVGAFPTLSVSPDGKYIAFDYIDKFGKKDVYLVSTSDKKVTCLTCDFEDDCYFPTWSPDSLQIAFTYETDGNADIYVINADGSNPALLIKNGMFTSWSR